VIADPSNASTTCIAARTPNTTVTALSGTGIMTLDATGSTLPQGFEVLPAGATRTATVDVVGTGAGMLHNVSGDLLADFLAAAASAIPTLSQWGLILLVMLMTMAGVLILRRY
jgi:hypothetical protein